jgi:dihydrofolate reductase
MQAPGAPEEDPTGGFAFGGWTLNYWNEDMGRSMNGLGGKDRELVLGRRTYEIFEAYWPYQPATRLRRRSTRPGSTWRRAR